MRKTGKLPVRCGIFSVHLCRVRRASCRKVKKEVLEKGACLGIFTNRVKSVMKERNEVENNVDRKWKNMLRLRERTEILRECRLKKQTWGGGGGWEGGI
jgi:hypothetical protein